MFDNRRDIYFLSARRNTGNGTLTQSPQWSAIMLYPLDAERLDIEIQIQTHGTKSTIVLMGLRLFRIETGREALWHSILNEGNAGPFDTP